MGLLAHLKSWIMLSHLTMRSLVLCLSLWFAVPAWANAIEDTVCERAPESVAEMANSQKLCRSFVMALEKVPGAMTGEVLALLTPESLKAMGTLTSAWIVSQGVPAVGQAVDAALLTLGLVLMAAQAAELSNALWEYAKKSLGARKQEDLEAAAEHLSRAIALAGVNVVTLILTKKVAGRLKRNPPFEPPPRPAIPPGTPPVDFPGQASPPSSVHMAANGHGGARSRPSPSAELSVSRSYRLVQVEAWRKPKLLKDGRIIAYPETRKPSLPVPNLGRNRAGQVITNGKHAVRFDGDGFPEFETQFEILLDNSHIGTGDRVAHFKAANQALFEAIQKDPSLARILGLPPETISRLPSLSKAPEGYSWHHHQDVGRMQLVHGDAHRLSIPHTGGMAIWGGGQ
jgi:hypothetical protein